MGPSQTKHMQKSGEGIWGENKNKKQRGPSSSDIKMNSKKATTLLEINNQITRIHNPENRHKGRDSISHPCVVFNSSKKINIIN